jgi:hypothetical protein
MKHIDKKLIILVSIILFCSKPSLRADTLLINTKHPDKHRILLYDGQYYIKLVLQRYPGDTSFFDLNVVGGTYKIKNNIIIFEDPAPMTDSIKNKFYYWPPRRAGPSYTFDLDGMVYLIFGVKIKIAGMQSINWVVGPGQILKDGRLKLGKEKYKITTDDNINFSSTHCLDPTIKNSEKLKDKPIDK